MGSRIRLHGGMGFPHPREQRGQGSSREQRRRGWGSRIRENNGGRLLVGGRGWVTASARTTGGGSSREQRRRGWGWVLASVFTGAGSRWEDTGGCTPILTFPPEGGRERGGGGGPPFLRRWALRGNDVDGRERGKGWVPAYARTTGWEREEG